MDELLRHLIPLARFYSGGEYNRWRQARENAKGPGYIEGQEYVMKWVGEQLAKLPPKRIRVLKNRPDKTYPRLCIYEGSPAFAKAYEAWVAGKAIEIEGWGSETFLAYEEER
jgi:hypothetical protein